MGHTVRILVPVLTGCCLRRAVIIVVMIDTLAVIERGTIHCRGGGIAKSPGKGAAGRTCAVHITSQFVCDRPNTQFRRRHLRRCP